MGFGDALATALPFAIAATYFSGAPSGEQLPGRWSVEHGPHHRCPPAHCRRWASPAGAWLWPQLGRGRGGGLVRRGCPACRPAASFEAASRQGAACGLHAIAATPTESALPRGVGPRGTMVGRTAHLHGCVSGDGRWIQPAARRSGLCPGRSGVYSRQHRRGQSPRRVVAAARGRPLERDRRGAGCSDVPASGPLGRPPAATGGQRRGRHL